MSRRKLLLVGLILIGGVLAISTAAILIRLAIATAGVQSTGFSLFVAASRLIFASLLLLPVWQQLGQPSPRSVQLAIAAGITLALHFATWITSLSLTSIAASTALVTTNPVWVALISWLCFRERLNKLGVLGISLALGGGITIALGDPNPSNTAPNPLLGNCLALIGAWCASGYLILGSQAQRRGLGISSYIAITYTTAALTLLPLPLLLGTGYTGYPLAVYGYIAIMALVSQVIGHTSLNWAVRQISPTIVALAVLFEPIAASLLGWLVFQEIPKSAVLLGASILLIGVALAVLAQGKFTNKKE